MSLSNYIMIGHFVPKHSFIHRLDPRSKLIFAFLFIILVFLAENAMGYIILSIIVLIGVIFSRIPLSYYFKGLIPILWMILFTTILHITMTKEGEIIFQWHWLAIYSDGIRQAIFIAIRLLLLVIIASLLTLTTSPIDLTVGMERLFSPLKRLKVPVNELALMMSISLRFIPTLLDETDKIMKAQKSRGANFESGPFHKRILIIVAIIIPLFVNAFKRAEDLANAMEARGYRGGEGRTRLRVFHFTWRDLTLGVLFISLLLLMMFIRGY